MQYHSMLSHVHEIKKRTQCTCCVTWGYNQARRYRIQEWHSYASRIWRSRYQSGWHFDEAQVWRSPPVACFKNSKTEIQIVPVTGLSGKTQGNQSCSWISATLYSRARILRLREWQTSNSAQLRWSRWDLSPRLCSSWDTEGPGMEAGKVLDWCIDRTAI